MTDHDQVYTILLGVAGGVCLSGAVMIETLARGVVAEHGGDTAPLVLAGALAGAYAVAMLAVTVLRVRRSRQARRLTRVLNIALLFVFPWGMALGAYGLIKADRRLPTPPLLDVFD